MKTRIERRSVEIKTAGLLLLFVTIAIGKDALRIKRVEVLARRLVVAVAMVTALILVTVVVVVHLVLFRAEAREMLKVQVHEGLGRRRGDGQQ